MTLDGESRAAIKRIIASLEEYVAELRSLLAESDQETTDMGRPTRMSRRGLVLLKLWEGVKLKPYLDSGGLETIGVGHLLTPAERSSGKIRIGDERVPYAGGLTMDQVLDLLSQDLAEFEECVRNSVMVDITQQQFDACVSLAFNIGVAGFSGSTALRCLNQQKFDEMKAAWRLWRRAGGKIVQGLVNRREKELTLFFLGYDAAEEIS